ncbi:trans-sialidase, partial [Trypanosoma rangeli]
KGIGPEPTEIPMVAGTGSFHTQLLKEGDNKVRDTVRPTTIVSGNSVYMLLGSCSRATPETREADRSGCKIVLVKGIATEGGEKKVQWNETYAVEIRFGVFVIPLSYLSAVGGSGTVMSDGRLVFPMQTTKNGKNVLQAVHFTPSENKWEPLVDPMGEGCHNPSIVEWGEVDDRRIFMIAPCTDGSYHVYRTLALHDYLPGSEPISQVWGNSRDGKGEGARSGFITATIDGMKVMLLTMPVYSEEKGEDQLHLWMTDNVRVHDVGPVSREGDDAAASSLLYRADKKELILLYENKKSGDSYSLVAVSLTEQLERIKSVVKAWKDMDTALNNCLSIGTVDPRIKNVCKSFVPTEGLAGFWSNSLEGNLWKDEYLGVNATVHGGNVAGTEWGVRFRGAGAGTEWPVGKLRQFQPYYFVNSEFTLVATVMIDVVPEADSPVPLMGVRMNDNASTVLVGLFYTKDKKWGVTVNGKSQGLSDKDGTWQPGTTYQVVLKKLGESLYVYVDNNEPIQERVPLSEYTSRGVLDFYVGGDGAKGTGEVDVTVGNVLLYNEALDDNELTSLSASKVTLPTPAAEGPLTTLGNDGEITSKLKPGEKRVGDGLNPKGPLPEEAHKGNHSAAEESGSSPAVGSESTSAILAKDTSNISLSGASSVAFDNLTRVRPNSGRGDGTVRGCVSRLFLLLLGLWGFAALC